MKKLFLILAGIRLEDESKLDFLIRWRKTFHKLAIIGVAAGGFIGIVVVINGGIGAFFLSLFWGFAIAIYTLILESCFDSSFNIKMDSLVNFFSIKRNIYANFNIFWSRYGRF